MPLSFSKRNTSQNVIWIDQLANLDPSILSANPNCIVSVDGNGDIQLTSILDASNLPSYVDDIVEFANYAAFPATGETGKIYVALDNSKIYRWSGSVYVNITNESHYTKSEIDDNIYTKTQIDTNNYTKTQIDTNNYTKTQIDANNYTKAQIDANNYTKTEIDTNNYTKTQIDANIYTKTQSDANYYNKSSVYTKTEIDTNNYTKTQIDANNYTKSEIDTNNYTKTQIDANIYTKTQVDTNNYTKTQIDANIYTKTQSDANYASKSILNTSSGTHAVVSDLRVAQIQAFDGTNIVTTDSNKHNVKVESVHNSQNITGVNNVALSSINSSTYYKIYPITASISATVPYTYVYTPPNNAYELLSYSITYNSSGTNMRDINLDLQSGTLTGGVFRVTKKYSPTTVEFYYDIPALDSVQVSMTMVFLNSS